LENIRRPTNLENIVYARPLFSPKVTPELHLEAASGGMSFKMLMEDSWKQELASQGI